MNNNNNNNNNKNNELFFKVFKNNYLRNKIFDNIKNLNKELYYFAYDFYNVPIELIIKTENKQLLIEKLKLHEKYFYNTKINNNNKLYNNNENYKYYFQIESNQLYKIYDWKEFNLELYQIIEKLYPGLLIIDQNAIHYFIQNCNLELLNYFIDKENGTIKNQKNEKFKLKELYFYLNRIKSTNEIYSTFQFLKETLLQIDDLQIILVLKQIVIDNKSNLYGEYFLNQLNLKISLSNHLISDLMEKVVYYSDLDMLNLILNKLNNQENNNNNNNNNNDNLIKIYDFYINKNEISNLSLPSYSLFRSNLSEFVIVYLEYTKKYHFQTNVLIKNPKVAEYIINKYFKPKGDDSNSKLTSYFYIQFDPKCLNEDLSNVLLFEKTNPLTPVKWKVVDDIPNLLIYEYLKSKKVVIKDTYFEKGFNGNLQFLKQYIKDNNNEPPSSSTLLSAAKNGYYDIVSYIIRNITFLNTTFTLETLIKVLTLCHQNEQVVDSIKYIYKLNICHKNFHFFFPTFNNKPIFKENFQERIQMISGLIKIPNLIEDFINSFHTSYSKFNDYFIQFYKNGFNPFCNDNYILSLKKSNYNLFQTVEDYDILISNNLFKEFQTILSVKKYLKTKPKLKELILTKLFINNNKSIKIKPTLYLIQTQFITSNFITHLLKLAIKSSNTLIIDLLLLLGPFKFGGSFKNLYNLSNLSLSNYLNEIHYLLFSYTLNFNQSQNQLKKIYLNYNLNLQVKNNDLKTNYLNCIKYLNNLNYRFNNQISDGISFLRYDNKNQKDLSNDSIQFNELNSDLQLFLKNCNLLNIKNLIFKNKIQQIEYQSNNILEINNKINNNLNFNF